MGAFEIKQSNTGYQLFIDGRLHCNLILIPKGTFKREVGGEVSVNKFYMAQFPVTQQFYEAVTGNNPSTFEGGQHPVEGVSWYDAVKFCGMLNNEFKSSKPSESSEPSKGSELLNLHNKTDSELNSFKLNVASAGFRLPTEAEWEYAARGGGMESSGPSESSEPPKGSELLLPYAGSNHLDMVGWYNKNNNYESKPVGLKFPNPFGLYDMSGNVWEWCWDWFGEYNLNELDNPIGAESGSYRVFRGGSWSIIAAYGLSAYRFINYPDSRNYSLGFRLVFVL